MGFNLSIPAKILAKELKDANKKTKKAGVRALNKTATKSRNFAQRETRKVINVKAATIKKAYWIKKAKIGQQKPEAGVFVSYKPFPVSAFNGVRQTKKGVTVRMTKNKPRLLFKSAFIRTLSSGHKGVFIRKGKKSLPIKELHGPSPYSVFVEKLDEVERASGDLLERLYQHELDFIFGRV